MRGTRGRVRRDPNGKDSKHRNAVLLRTAFWLFHMWKSIMLMETVPIIV